MPQYRNIPAMNLCYSDVARGGERALCVSVPELVACGIAESYIVKRALPCQRAGEVNCWPHHKDGGTVWVHYDGLKDKYKRLVDSVLCEGVEANLWVMNREAGRRTAERRRVLEGLGDMLEVTDVDVELVANTGLFDGRDAQRIARTAGWLRLWRRMDVKTARRMGFASVVEIQEALFELCLCEQADGLLRFAKPVNCRRVLDRKAREFATGGLSVLIGGYFGNANRRVIDTRIHAVLMDLACSPLKYSFEDIGMIYNGDIAPGAGLARMTVSAIKGHLNLPVYKKVWFGVRHGKLVADDQQQLLLRRGVSGPDRLWSVDGTTMQLYYRDGQGKVKSDLYVYFVTDVFSGAIIGVSVAFAETSQLVGEALKMAIDRYGYRPFQVQYDNSSANVGDYMRSLMDNLTRVHFPCQPYKGRSKYVECYIGHFQQCVLRTFGNFKGSNVTSNGLNGKANPELLEWLKKNPGEMPDERGVIGQFMEAVELFNARGERRNAYGEFVGDSKIGRYTAECEGRVKLNYFDRLSLFMVKLGKRYRYGQRGIKLIIGGRAHYFIVPDADGVGDFVFASQHLNVEFTVRVNINNPDFVMLYDGAGRHVADAREKVAYAACVADLREGEAAEIMRMQRKQEDFGYAYCLRELGRQRRIGEGYGLKATGTGDFFGFGIDKDGHETFGWMDRVKGDNNVIEGRLEDVENGVAARLSDFELRMLELTK